MIDEGFIGRVYRTSGYVWVFGALVAWSAAGPYAALGWTVGSAVSVGVLAAIELMVKRAARPGDARAGRKLMRIAALHWPVILAVLAAAIWLGERRISYVIAFCVGLGLAQAVIVLKAFGALILQYLNRE